MLSDEKPEAQAELQKLLWEAGQSPDVKFANEKGDGVYAEALYALTRMRFEEDEARRFWREIRTHREELQRQLGRDVGLRVAVCDYFLNLHPRIREAVIVEVQVLLQKEKRALVDDLTGLYNRRYFDDAMRRELECFQRFEQRFALIMIDVDFFKRFNDTFGHSEGDVALKTVAAALRETARSFDHVTRYGGEEFAVILPHSGGGQALVAAERLRCAVATHPVPVAGRDEGIPLTVSLGVATFPDDAANLRDLVDRADAALYEAKRTRNSCRGFADDGSRFVRRPLRLVLVRRDAAVDAAAQVEAVNVSFGGMLCTSPKPILPGTEVDVLLDGGSRKEPPLAVCGRVVRLERGTAADDYEIALAFHLTGEEERRNLERLVELNQAAGPLSGGGEKLLAPRRD